MDEKIANAIDGLKRARLLMEQYIPDKYCANSKRTIDRSIELLKEQEEPKQIIRKQCKTEHSDGSVDYFAEWYCPHCNMLILRGFDNPSIKFCYKCGKPIAWEGR